MREEWRGERDKERMKELKEEKGREIISENEKGWGMGERGKKGETRR